MAVVLLVPFGERGHTEPMAALGRRLLGSGHRVAVLVEDRAAEPVHRAGLDVLTPRRWRTGTAVPPEVVAAGDPAAMLRHLFFGSVRDMTADVVDAAADTGAEVIVADVFAPGGGLAADRLGLPWVSLSCSPVPELDAYRAFLDPAVLPCFELPEGNLLGRVSPRLHLIPATARFAGRSTPPGPAVLVGPLLTDEPAQTPAAPARKPAAPARTVAVTTSSAAPATLGGSARTQERFLRVAVDAFAGLDLRAVVVLPAGTEPGTLPPAPPNVRYVGPQPHGPLFARCAAVVTHGGWGTVGRALHRGLPVVALPLVNDQHWIAGRCADLGAGIACDPSAVGAGELREAVRAVCEEPRYRRAAGELAADLRAAAPLETSARLIGSLLEER